MSNLPDAAYIRNLRNTGYRDGKDPTYPVCPICEQTCETIYISADKRDCRLRPVHGDPRCVGSHRMLRRMRGTP